MFSVTGVCTVFPGSERQRHQAGSGWSLCGDFGACCSGEWKSISSGATNSDFLLVGHLSRTNNEFNARFISFMGFCLSLKVNDEMFNVQYVEPYGTFQCIEIPNKNF